MPVLHVDYPTPPPRALVINRFCSHWLRFCTTKNMANYPSVGRSTLTKNMTSDIFIARGLLLFQNRVKIADWFLNWIRDSLRYHDCSLSHRRPHTISCDMFSNQQDILRLIEYYSIIHMTFGWVDCVNFCRCHFSDRDSAQPVSYDK